MAFLNLLKGKNAQSDGKNPDPTISAVPNESPEAALKKKSPESEMDDIFAALSGNADGSPSAAPKNPNGGFKKNALRMFTTFSSNLFVLVLVGFAASGVDVLVRGAENSDLVNMLPVCDYLALGVDNRYVNDECLTISQIRETKTKERGKVEETIANNLLVLVPKKLEAEDVLSSPEVQFIKEHTGDSRIPFRKVVADFYQIVNRTEFQGQDIECDTFKFTEAGNFDVTCKFYGDKLNSSDSKSNTSRMTAIAFFDRLSLTSSNFKVVSLPKSLNISKYVSTEIGTKSTFSTITSASMSLRYVPTTNNAD